VSAAGGEVTVGLGRIVALCDHPSALYQILQRIRCLYFSDDDATGPQVTERVSGKNLVAVAPKAGSAVAVVSGVRYAPLYIFEHLVGENIHRYPISLTSLECQVSALVNSDTCPCPTTARRPRSSTGCSTGGTAR
jgi:hypothetical protein